MDTTNVRTGWAALDAMRDAADSEEYRAAGEMLAGAFIALHGWPQLADRRPDRRECTPAESEQWTSQHGDGYRTGAGDARADRAPRIQLVPVPAEVPGETGSRYVARHVARAWAIGYTTGYMRTAGRPLYPDCDWSGVCAETLADACPRCGGHCMRGPGCDHIARNGAS